MPKIHTQQYFLQKDTVKFNSFKILGESFGEKIPFEDRHLHNEAEIASNGEHGQ